MPNEVKAPDVTAWSKAWPLLAQLIGTVLVALATGNWVNVGTEALKDWPTIMATLGFGGAGVGSLLVGLISSFVKSGNLADIIKRLSSQASGQGIFPQATPGEPSQVIQVSFPGFVLSVDAAQCKADAPTQDRIVSAVKATLNIPSTPK